MSKCPYRIGTGEYVVASWLFKSTMIVIESLVGRIIVIKYRQMPGTLWKWDIQTTTRINLSKQYFSNSSTFLFASIPLYYYSFTVIFYPRHGKRLTCYKYHYGGLTSSFHCSDEGFLTARKADIRKIKTLTTYRIGPGASGRTAHCTNKEQSHIAIAGCSYSLTKSTTVLRVDFTAFSIINLYLALGDGFDALQRSDAIFITIGPHIVTKLYLGGIGTDYSDRTKFICIEWK